MDSGMWVTELGMWVTGYELSTRLRPSYDLVAFSPPVHTDTMKTIMKTHTFEYANQSGWKRIRVTGVLVGDKFAIRTSSII